MKVVVGVRLTNGKKAVGTCDLMLDKDGVPDYNITIAAVKRDLKKQGSIPQTVLLVVI